MKRWKSKCTQQQLRTSLVCGVHKFQHRRIRCIRSKPQPHVRYVRVHMQWMSHNAGQNQYRECLEQTRVRTDHETARPNENVHAQSMWVCLGWFATRRREPSLRGSTRDESQVHPPPDEGQAQMQFSSRPNKLYPKEDLVDRSRFKVTQLKEVSMKPSTHFTSESFSVSDPSFCVYCGGQSWNQWRLHSQ